MARVKEKNNSDYQISSFNEVPSIVLKLANHFLEDGSRGT
jgi:hypothetical protein